jgi:hypothetical protein
MISLSLPIRNNKIKLSKKAKLVLFAIAFGLPVFIYTRLAIAAACTWNSTGSNSWNTIGNWNCGHVPTSSDSVTFDGTSSVDVTIDATVSVGTFSINSGYGGIISQGSNSMTMTGFSQATGTFTGGSANMYVGTGTTGANFNITGGSFKAPSTILHITGNFTQSGSPIWDSNGGTVALDGNYGGNTYVDVSGITLNLVTINRVSSANATLTIYNGTTIPLANSTTVTLQNNGGSSYHYLVNNGTIKAGTGTLTVTVRGNWSNQTTSDFTNNGTLDLSAASSWVMDGNYINNTTLNADALTSWSVAGSLTNNTSKSISANGISSLSAFSLTNNGTISATNSATFTTSGWDFTNNSGATFTAKTGSTTFNVAASFVINSGSTFPTTGVTLNMNGTPAAADYTLDAPTVAFDKVTFNRTIQSSSVRYLTIVAGTTVPLGNNSSQTISSGNTGYLYLVNNGTISASGTLTMTQTGNWGGSYGTFINNSTLDFSSLTSWTGNDNFTNNVDLDISNLTSWSILGTTTQAAGKTLTAAGLATLSTGNVTNNGTFNIPNATSISMSTLTNNSVFTATNSATFTTSGSFTNNSGATFNHKSGAITLNVAASLYISPTSAYFPLSNVTLNLNGSYNGGNTSVDAPTVNFTLVTINREMVAGGGTQTYLTIAAGTTIPLGNTPTVTLKNNSTWGGSVYSLTNNGTITVGTGTLTINLIGNSSGPGTFTDSGSMDLSSATGWTMSGNYINNTTLNADTLTSWTVGGYVTNNANKTINAAGIAAWSIGGTTGGSLTNNGTINMSNCTTFTTQASFINNSGAYFNPKSGAITLNVGANFTISQTSAYFPLSNVTLNLNGSYNGGDTSVDAPTVNFTLVTINREMARGGGLTTYLTIAAGTTIPLGNSPTITLKDNSTWGGSNYSLTNNGTITVGTGTLTVYLIGNSGYSMTGTFTNNGILDLTSTSTWVMNGHFTNNASKSVWAGSNLNFTAWANVTVSAASEFPTTLGTLTISGSTGTQTITLPRVVSYGELSKTAASTWTPSGNMTITGAMSYTGGTIGNPGSAYTIHVGGNFTQSTGTLGGNNLTIDFNGSGTQTINKSGGTFASKFTVSGPGIAQLVAAFSTSGTTCTVSGGSFDINGKSFTCGSTFTIQKGGTLVLLGTETPTTPVLNAGSTVVYKGNGDGQPNTYFPKDWLYSNLTINMTDSQDTLSSLGTTATQSGLVAYWPMDEASGTTTVSDSTGNGNTGTSTSSTNVTTGKSGNARSFSGTEYISITDHSGLNGTKMTVAGWVYPTTFVTGAPIYNRRTTPGNVGGVTVELNGTSGSVGCYFYISGAWRVASSATLLTLSQWNHVACTYDGSIIKPYINGTIDSNTTSISGSINQPSSPSVEIARNISSAAKWQGNLDETRIYDRALTATEISNLYYQYSGIASLTLTGNFTVSSGTFISPSTLTIAGNFTNNGGTFNNNSGTVIFNDNSKNSLISGSGAIEFYNLTVTTPLKHITFASGKTIPITGALTLTGTYGYPVVVNSSSGSQWFVNKSGTAAVTYSLITNSGCDGASGNITLNGSNQNGGNNGPCWVFGDTQSTLNMQGINVGGINVN